MDGLATAKLASSGLTDIDAKSLGIVYLSPLEASKITPYSLPALKLQYYSPKGELKKGTYRVRFLATPIGSFGEAIKVPKYLQPENTPPSVYFPKSLPWKSLLEDASKPLVITEGEFKAACATKHGIPTIALGGVWSFGSKSAGLSFLPELEDIRWLGRQVTLCFDSDTATNPKVAKALHYLTRELRNRGALVSIATIPPSESNDKVGLDDFIVSHGIDTFKLLLNNATPDALTPELHRFNSRFAAIQTGMIYEEAKAIHFSFSNFLTLYSNEKVKVTTPDGKTKPVNVAKEWLEWSQRQTYEALTYEPGKDRVIGGKLNTWRGFACPEAKGDIAPFMKLVDHLFTDTPREAKEWFLRWIAFPIANPGTKLLSAVGVWSENQGQGKSLIGTTLGRIYGDNYCAISQEELEASFNGWVVNRQFVMVDEVSGYDSHHKAAILKKMITEETLIVRKKYVAEYVVPTCANFYLTSNRANAFHLDKEDRRYFIHEVKVKSLPPDFYHAYYRWLETEGPSALLYHFRRMNFGDFHPAIRPPMTQAKEAMIESSMSDVEHWLREVKDDPDSKLRVGQSAIKCDLLTADQLLALYVGQGAKPVTRITMGMQANRVFARASDNQLRTKHGRARYFIVRNLDKWIAASPKAMVDHIDHSD